MKRYLVAIGVAIIGGLFVAVAEPVTAPAPEVVTRVPAPAEMAACPVTIARNVAGRLTVASTVTAEVVLSTSQQGSVDDVRSSAPGPAGDLVVPFEDLVASGTAVTAVEFGTDAAAAAVATADGNATVAGNCTAPSVEQVSFVGTSTRSGTTLEAVLVNPYANDAVVTLLSNSEAGIDSASELASIIVPARSVVVRDLSQVLPLRERLNVTMRPESGVAHLFGVETVGAERAVVEAVPQATTWHVPLPVERPPGLTVTISSAAPIPVSYQIDASSGGVVEEAILTGTIDAGAHAVVDLTALPEEVEGITVVAEDGVVVGLRSVSDGGLAISPAVAAPGTDVLIPGVLAPDNRLMVHVPSAVDADFIVVPVAEGATPFPGSVAAGSTGVFDLPPSAGGYLIRSSTELAILVESVGTGRALVAGVPIDGG